MNSASLSPITSLFLGLPVVVLGSFCCAWLAKIVTARQWLGPATRQIAIGLVCCGPILVLALLQMGLAAPQDVAPVAAGTALTYVLLAPALLLGGGSATHPSKAWRLWRRAVLPFLLAISAMWFIIAASGGLSWLKGQFLITLFALGTWLFTMDEQAGSALSSPGTEGIADEVSEWPHQSAQPRLSLLSILLGLFWLVVAVVFSLLAAAVMLVLLGSSRGQIRHLGPILGVCVCVGPLVLARRRPAEESGEWLAGLGYGCIVAYCLAPGISVFGPALSVSLQTNLSTAAVYVPDAALIATVSALLLGVDEGSAKRVRLIGGSCAAIWLAWAAWVIASGFGAR